MDNELLEQVKDFVAEFWREPKGNMSSETSVNEDLGVDGDDGVEFMETFAERFAVDLSSFPHARYFGPEAAATPLSMVKGIVRRVRTRRWSGLAPLTLRTLAEAAGQRRWPIESRTKI